MKYAKVAVEAATYSFDMEFEYIVPDALEEEVCKGCRVKVPFGKGNRSTIGIVMNVSDNPDGKRLKEIYEILDSEHTLSDEMIQLSRYIKDRTFCTLYEALRVMLPPGTNHKIVKLFAVNPDADEKAVNSLSETEREFFAILKKKAVFENPEKVFREMAVKPDTKIVSTLLKKKLLITTEEAVRNLNDPVLNLIKLRPEWEDIKLTQRQLQICNFLEGIGMATSGEICDFIGCAPTTVSTLVKKGAAEIVTVKREFQDRFSEKTAEKTDILLTQEQEKAFEELKKHAFSEKRKTALLYGVTGSGKTSVYLKLIDEVLEKGKDVLVLVPEIGLTPQALSIFCKRYGKDIAVFHSALSLRERNEMWKKVKDGKARIVIGTRSAVFAPLPNLGLIIIDEEQEHTYKSEQSPRYNAIEIAKYRCAYHNCLLVLASATPSVESYAAAQEGKYELCTLKNRYGKAELPDVITVDMRTCEKVPGCRELSKELFEALKLNLENKKQSILLINRRGYNTFAVCDACGSVITCENCSISMTYHIRSNKLLCHYCGAVQPVTEECPYCGEKAVRYAGYGTQKIEDELATLLPEARILRMDADTTGEKNSHEKLLSAFERGEYDIMLGTQMVAKGLNFPNVTLVGVISVDQQLYNDDFRALEKTFSLLTQVVGRSGRGDSKGIAVIQTLTPENEIIRLAAKQDYDEFFDTEIKIRKGMTYPPYCELCVIGTVGEDEGLVRSASRETVEIIKKLYETDYRDEKLIVLGPVPARVARVGGKFRYRIIVKCRNTGKFREMISKAIANIGANPKYKNVTAYADMNPDCIL